MQTEEYLHGLNTAQKEAVLHTEGPLLIVAGAGAGKTRTITHRIVRLLEGGVQAGRLLAVTFTNKAATEMRERVERLRGRHESPLLMTFHSLGARLLREFYESAGIARNFSIWDKEDGAKAVRGILASMDDSSPPRSVLATISRAKGNAVTHEQYARGAGEYWERTVADVWKRYEKILRDEQALDFDDLLLRTLELLQKKDVLSLLQSRWHYITVDEYQDTNRAQMEIARLLAGERKNICVVGDVDQNIYSWRGADIEHLLSFEKTFPGSKVVTLEENYRSTRTILAAANSVIAKNVRRTPKNLFTKNETGDPLWVYGAESEMDEAWFIAETARGLLEKGIAPEEIAVLYRENFQSRVLEEAFLHADIPYQVLGTRFIEREEIKDLLSYLHAAQNPKNRSAYIRAALKPSRGIGKITLEKLFGGQRENVSSASRAKVEAFERSLQLIRHATHTLPAPDALSSALRESTLAIALERDVEGGKERLRNLYELINLSTRYVDMAPPTGVEKLLEDAALQSEQDELREGEGKKGVVLMTAHASKGLEFDVVFISGLEQGLFPEERADTSRDPEEERRLFYVALTRARKKIFLSYARARMKYGSRDYTVPSEFFEDID
ncbi:MAG: UvrD-helicase domain-containing protein, partial [Parcubacteria group bacterium]|nr:UvrD-helicase domain-containing protein [Parcubacteria group bacterium]